MWREDKTWLHYVKNIIAADVSSAVFLAYYLRRSGVTRDYLSCLEIIDLQRYRLIRKPVKIKTALQERANIPFIFVVGKN